MIRILAVSAVIALGLPFAASAQTKPLSDAELKAYGDGAPLECDHLAEIDEARQRDIDGFDRLIAGVSTMTMAGFCGEIELARVIEERISDEIAAYDDRIESLSIPDQRRLRQVKVAYVNGRQMLERSQ